MLGQLIDSLDDPDVALRLVAALEQPSLSARPMLPFDRSRWGGM
jgi:hypothetical protein